MCQRRDVETLEEDQLQTAWLGSSDPKGDQMSEDFEFEHKQEPSFNIMNFYFSPKGRIGRANYWIGSIPLAIICFAAGYFIPEEHYLLFMAIVLPVVFIGVILNIKRSHDRDKTGWFTLLFFIPIISFWPTIELGFFRGTEGLNKFGSDPVPSSSAGSDPS